MADQAAGRRVAVVVVHGVGETTPGYAVNELVELFLLRDADDRRCYAWLLKYPRESDLNRQHVLPARDIRHFLRDIVIRIGVIQAVAVIVVFLAQRRVFPPALAVPGEETARQRAPRDEADAFRYAWTRRSGDLGAAARHHLVFVFVVPFLIYLYVAWTAQHMFGRRLPQLRITPKTIGVVLAVWFTFSALRNLPWAPFDWFYV